MRHPGRDGERLDAMYDAVLGYRTRRSAYMKRAEVTEQSATRDLAALAAADILAARGTGRGRHYVAGPILREIQERRRSARKPIRDPWRCQETAAHWLKLEAGRQAITEWERENGPLTEAELADGLARARSSLGRAPAPAAGRKSA